jgi:hypothetical protein
MMEEIMMQDEQNMQTNRLEIPDILKILEERDSIAGR